MSHFKGLNLSSNLPLNTPLAVPNTFIHISLMFGDLPANTPLAFPNAFIHVSLTFGELPANMCTGHTQVLGKKVYTALQDIEHFTT